MLLNNFFDIEIHWICCTFRPWVADVTRSISGKSESRFKSETAVPLSASHSERSCSDQTRLP
jgi:hypothetical protein